MKRRTFLSIIGSWCGAIGAAIGIPRQHKPPQVDVTVLDDWSIYNKFRFIPNDEIILTVFDKSMRELDDIQTDPSKFPPVIHNHSDPIDYVDSSWNGPWKDCKPE